jgi:prolyl oligopeptidase
MNRICRAPVGYGTIPLGRSPFEVLMSLSFMPRCLSLLLMTSAASLFAQAPIAADAPTVGDPYLWLEPFESPRANVWVQAENAKTLAVLTKDPRFDLLHEQALAIVQNRDRIPMPQVLGGKVYNFWRDAQHVRGVWRVATQADYDGGGTPAWQAVLDLDQLAADEKANWVWKGAVCEPRAQRRCLLLLSDGGEDAVTAREFDLSMRRFVSNGFVLPKGKQRLAWLDANALLVAREWNPGELTTSSYPYIVKRLRRGKPLSDAHEVFRGSKDDGGYGVTPQVLLDAKGHRAALIVRPLSTFEFEHHLITAAGPRRLAVPGKSDVASLFDGQLIVRLREAWGTGDTALPTGSLAAVDLARANAHPDRLRPALVWQPGPRQALEDVEATSERLLLCTLDNVRGRLSQLTRTGRGAWSAKPLSLPDNTTVRIVDADARGTSAYLQVAGYLQPTSLWRTSAMQSAATRVRSAPALFDAAATEVEQFEATSTDGTRIPYFIVHPKAMTLDGSHPTILYAYGGFNASLSPAYSAVTGKLWIERGGVWVVANIRGGGEFGPAWHEAGLKTKRQIVYDDFAAVARDLITRKVTSPRRLGIMGGSNGGLLMGVQMTQHPELFHAIDIQVPLLDMERMEQIAAGTSWVGEYGSQAVPEEREFLARISPYRQLRRGQEYPVPLVWTTTKDDRVGPQHARKFAARMAEYGIPYWFYEVTEGGHSAGANLKQQAFTSALEFTYFARQLVD